MLLPVLLALASGAAGDVPAAPLPQASPASEASESDARSRLDEVARLHDAAREALEADRPEEARALVREALELVERAPAVELDETAAVLVNELGLVAWQAHAPDLARTAWARVVDAFERMLTEDHPDLASARTNLAVALRRAGEHAGARELQEAVLAARRRTLPEDHPDLLRAQAELATTLRHAGELAEARALQEAVLAASARTLPEDHPDLLQARGSLAVTLRVMGDLAGARALQEAVLAASERTLPEDHPDLVADRGNLAVTLWELGDLAGARALEEAVLAAYERTLPEDHPTLLTARGNLAVTLRAMGDLAGARDLHEAVLAACERTLPEDHPKLARARGNLAATLGQMGDLASARVLEEAVLATFERTLPEDHPVLLDARGNLAVTLGQMGDRAGARALQEAVLAACERTLPRDHPGLVLARSNLAATLSELGDAAGARPLLEAVLEACERTRPEDHPELVTARGNLAIVLASLGDRDGLAQQTRALTRGVARRLASGLAGSPRAAEESARAEAHRLSLILFFADSLDSPPELQRGAFEAIELARHVRAAGGVRLADDDANEELARLRAEAATLRSRLNDLLAAEGGGEDFARLVRERDALEARLRQRLAASGTFLERIDAEALAGALPERAAAVGFWRYTRVRFDGEERGRLTGEACLLAHVLRADGSLARLELGRVAEVEALVRAWRAAVGEPLERGMAPGEPADDVEGAAARALAERVLAPVLEAAGDGVTTLFVGLDDALHLVPLDALPLPGDERGRLLGEAYELRLEVSFARLLRERATPDGLPALVALGGASFSSSPAPTGDDEADEDASPAGAGADRAGPGGQTFGPLRETRYEAENLAELFDEVFGRAATVLTRKGATKAALAAAARGARWLHVATHGYFAPESVPSAADPEPDAGALWSPMTAAERVTGLAPLALCGLALTGANLGRDSLGRVPGILSAEELAGWDLSACELAVLSACETNVGITRAGQGLQSLQAALHMAGARASITSLWKVDDELTRALMEDLYTRLWVNGEPKAEALWNAKMALRGRGARPRDWAGWLLVGDPD